MNLRRIITLYLGIFCLLSLAACGVAAPLTDSAETPALDDVPLDWDSIPNPLPQSLKGYELFCWKIDFGWAYTIVTATNRNKSFEEITSADTTINDEELIKITLTNIEDLLKLIERMPAGEEIFWGGINLAGQVSEGTAYFTYPPAEDVERILQSAEVAGVSITMLGTP